MEALDIMGHTWPLFIMKIKCHINLVEVSVSRMMLNSCRDYIIAALCMILHLFTPKDFIFYVVNYTVVCISLNAELKC